MDQYRRDGGSDSIGGNILLKEADFVEGVFCYQIEQVRRSLLSRPFILGIFLGIVNNTWWYECYIPFFVILEPQDPPQPTMDINMDPNMEPRSTCCSSHWIACLVYILYTYWLDLFGVFNILVTLVMCLNCRHFLGVCRIIKIGTITMDEQKSGFDLCLICSFFIFSYLPTCLHIFSSWGSDSMLLTGNII